MGPPISGVAEDADQVAIAALKHLGEDGVPEVPELKLGIGQRDLASWPENGSCHGRHPVGAFRRLLAHLLVHEGGQAFTQDFQGSLDPLSVAGGHNNSPITRGSPVFRAGGALPPVGVSPATM